VLLLVFGAKRLPEMGRSLGKGMREFKESVSGMDERPSQDPLVEISPPADSDEHEHAEKPERETVS
jgi:sec-independent protein translocase protein TatA